MKESSFMIDLKRCKMNDKDKLRKLLKIIGDLLKVEGNEWLVDEILMTIGEKSPVEEIAKHPLLQNIHEYCVEQIIVKQAKEFYASFPILKIKDELIKDYMKMEHERRRDDFRNFCLCMYQQIENITNHIYNTEVKDGWEKDKNIKIPRGKEGGTQTIKDFCWIKSYQKSINKWNEKDIAKWNAKDKFKGFLIYYYFNKQLQPSDLYTYHNLNTEFEALYEVRNLNHRGGIVYEKSQAIQKDIKGNESKFYFRFYNFFQDVISKNIESFPNLKEYEKKKAEDKAETKNKIKRSAPNLGNSHPALKQLKNQMKK